MTLSSKNKTKNLSDCFPVALHPASTERRQPLPFFNSIQAGFPSPADEYMEKPLDLNELIIKRPAATFFVRVQGDSMEQAGIFAHDILVVDRSLTPASGMIVVAVLEGEFTVKRLFLKEGKIYLLPENPAYSPIQVHADSQFQVWGVVTYVIHKAQ